MLSFPVPGPASFPEIHPGRAAPPPGTSLQNGLCRCGHEVPATGLEGTSHERDSPPHPLRQTRTHRRARHRAPPARGPLALHPPPQDLPPAADGPGAGRRMRPGGPRRRAAHPRPPDLAQRRAAGPQSRQRGLVCKKGQPLESSNGCPFLFLKLHHDGVS